MILSFLDGITLVKKEPQVPLVKEEKISSGELFPVALTTEKVNPENIPHAEDDIKESEDKDSLKNQSVEKGISSNEPSFEMKYKMLLKQLEKERYERELITGK